MYEVFFNDRIMMIGSEVDANSLTGRFERLKIADEKSMHVAVAAFIDKGFHDNLLIAGAEPEALFAWFRSFFVWMEAAGGLVENNLGELLCIYRLGRWDLPKGKVEKGETYTGAAMREVEEECGIENLCINNLVSETYHVYQHPAKPRKYVLKKTYWYSMVYNGHKQLTPQYEEDIEEARWCSADFVREIMNLSYASLKVVFEKWLILSKHSV